MKTKTIVIVEDDFEIRNGLEEFLQNTGYLIRTAANGKLGLECIKELKGQCLVLLDLQMPIMNGQQMLEALDGDHELNIEEIPIIIITAGIVRPIRQKTIGHLNKPLDLEVLIKKIEDLFKKLERGGFAAHPGPSSSIR